MWNYTLEELAQGCDGSKPHVQRGLNLFANQGIITIKRHGPKASEYTVNFEENDIKELSPKSYQNDIKELSTISKSYQNSYGFVDKERNYKGNSKERRRRRR